MPHSIYQRWLSATNRFHFARGAPRPILSPCNPQSHPAVLQGPPVCPGYVGRAGATDRFLRLRIRVPLRTRTRAERPGPVGAPARAARAHAGQPDPSVLVETAVRHSWPQRHHSFRLERAPSCEGSIPGLRVGCSCAAMEACLTASDRARGTLLCVLPRRLSPQTGHPEPFVLVLVETAVRHSWPQVAQRHQTR